MIHMCHWIRDSVSNIQNWLSPVLRDVPQHKAQLKLLSNVAWKLENGAFMTWDRKVEGRWHSKNVLQIKNYSLGPIPAENAE